MGLQVFVRLCVRGHALENRSPFEGESIAPLGTKAVLLHPTRTAASLGESWQYSQLAADAGCPRVDHRRP